MVEDLEVQVRRRGGVRLDGDLVAERRVLLVPLGPRAVHDRPVVRHLDVRVARRPGVPRGPQALAPEDGHVQLPQAGLQLAQVLRQHQPPRGVVLDVPRVLVLEHLVQLVPPAGLAPGLVEPRAVPQVLHGALVRGELVLRHVALHRRLGLVQPPPLGQHPLVLLLDEPEEGPLLALDLLEVQAVDLGEHELLDLPLQPGPPAAVRQRLELLEHRLVRLVPDLLEVRLEREGLEVLVPLLADLHGVALVRLGLERVAPGEPLLCRPPGGPERGGHGCLGWGGRGPGGRVRGGNAVVGGGRAPPAGVTAPAWWAWPGGWVPSQPWLVDDQPS